MARGGRKKRIIEVNLRLLTSDEIIKTLNKLRPDKDIEQAKRLLSKVKVLIDKQCWIIKDDWDYYPQFEGVRTNRLSYELFIGTLIFDSLHHCDRKGCINPDHLFQGKDRANRKDWIEKKANHEFWVRREMLINRINSGGKSIHTPNKIIKPWHSPFLSEN